MPIIPTRKPSVVVKPTWTERTAIYRYQSGRIAALDGLQYGTLVVHVSLPEIADKVPVTVSHRPSMVAVFRMDTVDDAIKAVEHLWSVAGSAFCSNTDSVDKTKIPPDVVRWINACNKERKFLPPLPS